MQDHSFRNAPTSVGLSIVMAPEEMEKLEGPRSMTPQEDNEFGSRLKSVISGIISFSAMSHPFVARHMGRALCAAHPRSRLPLLIGIIRDDPEAFDRMFESLSHTSRRADRIARFNIATTLGSFARHYILIEALSEESLDEVSTIMEKIRKTRGKS